MDTYKIISDSESTTKKIASQLSELFESGNIILLDGDLGAGKTHFVKGVATTHNYPENDVTSPTFTIANFYKAKEQTLLHMDLYRIESIEEFQDLGLTDYFDDAIVLIEWGKRIEMHLEEYLSISFNLLDDANRSREICFSYKGKEAHKKIDLIAKKLELFK